MALHSGTESERMTKAKRYDTVTLTDVIGAFPKGEKGAVVEVYTTPFEAYDIEFVGDDGRTKGLLEAVRPEQLEVVAAAETGVRFATIRLEAGGTSVAVQFSDGKELHVSAETLHALAG